MAPNLELLGTSLFQAGNRLAFYTALLVGHKHPGFRFLLEHPYPEIDYIMASFHPEAEKDEARYFERVRLLKEAGHRVFLRFIGHPQRLHRLQDLSDRCRELDICFYPTAMLSNTYPGLFRSRKGAASPALRIFESEHSSGRWAGHYRSSLSRGQSAHRNQSSNRQHHALHYRTQSVAR